MDQDYNTFLEENSVGWCVVYIGREISPKRPIFTNVTGVFPTKEDAQRRANSMRRKYKRQNESGWAPSEMVKISVRPIWNKDMEDK